MLFKWDFSATSQVKGWQVESKSFKKYLGWAKNDNIRAAQVRFGRETQVSDGVSYSWIFLNTNRCTGQENKTKKLLYSNQINAFLYKHWNSVGERGRWGIQYSEN